MKIPDPSAAKKLTLTSQKRIAEEEEEEEEVSRSNPGRFMIWIGKFV